MEQKDNKENLEIKRKLDFTEFKEKLTKKMNKVFPKFVEVNDTWILFDNKKIQIAMVYEKYLNFFEYPDHENPFKDVMKPIMKQIKDYQETLKKSPSISIHNEPVYRILGKDESYQKYPHKQTGGYYVVYGLKKKDGSTLITYDLMEKMGHTLSTLDALASRNMTTIYKPVVIYDNNIAIISCPSLKRAESQILNKSMMQKIAKKLNESFYLFVSKDGESIQAVPLSFYTLKEANLYNEQNGNKMFHEKLHCYNKETEKLVLAKKLEKEIETIHESLPNDLEFDE